MNLLLVEDEKPLVRTLTLGLSENGFTVDVAPDGEAGMVMAAEPIYDLIVLDVMLPGHTGLEILTRLRTKGIATPVLLLTARGEISDRVAGLNAGADDYLAKPFDFSELLARIWSLIRRSKQQPFPTIRMADFELDPRAQIVRRGGKEIVLTPREYQLLAYLALNRERVISRSEIVDHLPELDSDSNLIDVHISKLRQKIDHPFASALLHTVRGRGYRLGESG